MVFLNQLKKNLLFLFATYNTLYSTLSSPSSISLSKLQLAIFNSKSSAKATAAMVFLFVFKTVLVITSAKREKRLLVELSKSPGPKGC